MPRHRRMRKPRVPKAQRAPKPPKIVRPKVRDLRSILKGLLTVSLSNRISSLSYAMKWYDDAIHYLMTKNLLTPEARKKIELAVKCRKKGIGITDPAHEHEKETAFLMAIRQYEKVAVALKPAPVDSFYKKFEQKKDLLAAKAAKMELKYGSVLQTLQSAIGPCIKLEVADAQKAMQYDPACTKLCFNREKTKELAQQFRAEGILSVFVKNLDVLARHAALEPDGSGGYQWSAEKQLETEHKMFEHFLLFAKSADAPNKLVKSGEARVAQPRLPGAPKAPRVSVKGPLVLGFLRPGTAIHTIFMRLENEQLQPTQLVIEGLTTADRIGRVKQLNKYGRVKGLFEIAITPQGIQLTFTQAGRELWEKEKAAASQPAVAVGQP